MLIRKNNFYLDKAENAEGKQYYIIHALYTDEDVIIAYISWNEEKQVSELKTEGENLQEYVVLYDQYQDFIYLVDEACYLLGALNK